MLIEPAVGSIPPADQPVSSHGGDHSVIFR
jgi:hypothetical protein